ncbi:unnamed protein product [Pseudo-nitzschia multistriata]|uniref:Uncharacterized protein n=1 Tax=Pseudo-nitzschia multistriata TaxID=183589 RepID=A0A448ZLH6_9STRA|nr:unnamed protein product [Pseudo-nitzschia multistriata]
MGRECTMVGVLALAEAFRIRVDVEYMDGRPLGNGGKLTKHTFGVNANDGSSLDGVNLGLLCITLLYRPGHYDILYK